MFDFKAKIDSTVMCILGMLLFTAPHVNGQQAHTTISGKVLSANTNEAIGFVNVFIEGTTEGAVTGLNGNFVFTTKHSGQVTLLAMCVGYDEYSINENVNALYDIVIKMTPTVHEIKEITIKAGNFNLANVSTLSESNAVDMVTSAGSAGDLYKSIGLLPGTQVSGTDGRLIVRGGSARETQTYIDGMHVLSPYTASVNNFSSRGKYSPFLFEGIQFSMGGYSSEYSQSLSAILPLDTKNESDITKLGIDIMNVSLGGGGTVAWDKGSSSLNFTYTDLSIYNKLFFPGQKKYWERPYRQYAAQNQYRFKLAERTYLKTYLAFDNTQFNTIAQNPFSVDSRKINYFENNLYLNTTLQSTTYNKWHIFSGIAFSYNKKDIKNALIQDDYFKDSEDEIHLKFKIGKRFNNVYRADVGIESMLRSST